jgi:hypothetical protein
MDLDKELEKYITSIYLLKYVFRHAIKIAYMVNIHHSMYSSFIYSTLHVHFFINHKSACSSRTIADLVKLPHVIRHTCNTQFTTKLAPFTARRVANGVSHASTVTFTVSLLDSPHMVWIPVVSNKA